MSTPAPAVKPAAPPETPPEPVKMPAQEIVNEFFGERLNKPAAAKPPEPAKPADKPKPKKPAARKPEPVAEPAAAPDYEAIATAAGRGVAEALRPKEPEKPAPADESAFLTEDEREMLPVLERMEALNPSKYKGLKGKYVENLKAVSEYQAQWEKDNPDETFDQDDKAHDAFFKAHEVGWSDLDERKAVADMVADSRVKEVEGRTNHELTELRTKERAREAEPAILAESLNADRLVFDLVGGEFKKILTKEGNTDAAVYAGLQETDPMALEIIIPEVLKIRAHCAEMLKLEKEAVAYNPKNPMHVFLADYAGRQEREILALPKADQAQGGKKFATSEEWGKMTESDRAKHWRLTAPVLNKLFATEYGQLAVKRLETDRKRLDALAPKYGYIKGNGEETPPARPAATPAAKPEEEEAEENHSPETTGVVLSTPAAKAGQHVPKNGTGAFFDKGW